VVFVFGATIIFNVKFTIKQTGQGQYVQATEEVQNDVVQHSDSVSEQVSVYLIKNDRLKKADLKRAEAFRDQNGGDLITLLVRLGLVSERDVAEAESSLLDLPLISTADLPDEAPDIGTLSLRYLKQNLLLPVAVTALSWPIREINRHSKQWPWPAGKSLFRKWAWRLK